MRAPRTYTCSGGALGQVRRPRWLRLGRDAELWLPVRGWPAVRPQLAEESVFKRLSAARERLAERLLEHAEPDRLVLTVVDHGPAAVHRLHQHDVLLGSPRHVY